MGERSTTFTFEPHLDARWVSIGLFVLTVPVMGGFESPAQWRLLVFALLMVGVALVIWCLATWRALWGQWFGLIAAMLLTDGAMVWLNFPGALAFFPAITTLAMVTMGRRAAVLGASAGSLLIVGQAGLGKGVEPALAIVVLASTAITLAVLLVHDHSLRDLLHWSWQRYQRADRLLEEARSQRAELVQTQEDLLQAYRTLALVNNKLAAMRLRAEEAEKAKADFVARISHELRTPLNMIIGLIDTATETPHLYGAPLPPLLVKDLEIVRSNSDHLATMINDVLSLSQIEAGHVSLHRSWADLSEDIVKAATIVTPLLEKKGLWLDLALPTHLSPVYCDRTRIRQVILNLMSNAARYTESGGIRVEARQEERAIIVSVKDTGPGIAPESASRIFEPFQQAGYGRGAEQNGSGLGLSISKQFVERHDGHIWLESTPGMGSTFAFRLPIFPPTPTVAGPTQWLNEGWVFRERTVWPKLPQSAQVERLVLCDENGVLPSLLEGWVDKMELVETHTVSEAVQAIRTTPAHAVLFNASTPAHLQAVIEQAQQEIEDTPLVGCCLPPPIDRALQAGAQDYLLKPISQNDLKESIAAIGLPLKRVLLVDDNADFRQLIARMLRIIDDELEITMAANGREALQMLRSEAPNLMILDISLPEMDGWEVLACKRLDPAIRDVPVILLSAADHVMEMVRSPVLLAAMGQGLTMGQAVRCSLQVARLLSEFGQSPDPAPG